MPEIKFKENSKALRRQIVKVAEELSVGEDRALQRIDKIMLRQILVDHLTGGTTATKLAVRTGRLRSSVTDLFFGTPEGPILIIGTNVVYAATHEFGDPRRNIPQRSFLRSSLKEKAGNIETIFGEEIGKALA